MGGDRESVRRVVAVSGKLSIVPMKGGACAAMKSMTARYGLPAGYVRPVKWPAKLTTQPGDAPPKLDSVDGLDPPGRSPPGTIP